MVSDAPSAAPSELEEPEATPADGELLLVDGNSLAYRAFFAIPDTISTEQGFPTNALYGLAAMMVKVLIDERPGRVVVCWDAPGKTFRHEAYPEYKAGRASTPDLLREQSPHFRPMMEAFGFVNTELPGFEADDVIGTLARRAEAAGERVTILTGDRDALQLVTDAVNVLATGRGVTDTVRYTPEQVVERYGVGPELMTDFRGLVGDSSDNLKGVPGIGEKGAAQLLRKYGTLDQILAHAAEQTPKRKEALITHHDDAVQSRDMSVIKCDADVRLELDDVPPLEFTEERVAALRDLFRRFEFASLERRLPELGIDAAPAPAAPPSVVLEVRPTPAAPEALGLRLAGADRAALAVDGDWAVADGTPDVLTGPFGEEEGRSLGAALSGVAVACHDFKAMPRALADAGLEPADDTMVGGFLLDPRRRGGYPLVELAAAAGFGTGEEAGEMPGAAHQAALVHALAGWQDERIRSLGLDPLYREVELPLVAVLAAMERAGIRVDVHRLGEIAGRVRERAEELQDRIWEMAGGEFVIDSPKQLGQVLFERLGLPTFRRGKTGWSTDRRVLKLLESKHEIVGLILQYRELTKLDNTYLAPLPLLVDPADGRLRTTFNQAGAETGRISSSNPNLQNIPIRSALGREVRSAFVADEGWRLVSFDYSQVELRILAHCSGETVLADAFRRGEDIHRATAAEVFGVPPEDVDRTLRDRAKAVNFGIAYGISDFGLADQLTIPRAEAAVYIDAYRARMPQVRRFIDTTIANATSDGYVTTLFGRRRPIPELTGRTRQQRQEGERLAVNTVVQGTAADIIKVAMVRAHRALLEARLAARLVLTIHDELLVESPVGELPRVKALVREAMTGAFALDPPLAVDVGVGETWLEAKG